MNEFLYQIYVIIYYINNYIRKICRVNRFKIPNNLQDLEGENKATTIVKN